MSYENDQAIENLREAGLVPAEQSKPRLVRYSEFEDVDSLLMGPPAAVKFAEPGTAVSGKITQVFARQATDFETREPKFWDDGNPVMEPVVILDTPDGPQTLYVSSAGLRNAIREACREAGLGLRPDGYLAVKYTADGTPYKKGARPPKIYQAAYDPPGRKRLDGSSELADSRPPQEEPPF